MVWRAFRGREREHRDFHIRGCHILAVARRLRGNVEETRFIPGSPATGSRNEVRFRPVRAQQNQPIDRLPQ